MGLAERSLPILLPCALAAAAAVATSVPAGAIVTAEQPAFQEPGRMETYDDLLARVEEHAPGFGGMFIDTDGRLAVYLLDPSELPAARAAIEAVFGADRLRACAHCRANTACPS
jgi:hypothetical protein